MTETIVICGYGPGISDGVARKFGAEGFHVALVARNAEKLDAAVVSLGEAGITAKGFPCDLADTEAVQAMIDDVRASLGAVTVIHYNAYAGVAGDVLAADLDDVRKVFDVGVTGLIGVIQAALPDMKSQTGRGAVLITGGGFAFYDAQVDGMIVQYRAMGLGIAKAAQHKLAGLLHHRLASEGVYVGEVLVLGMVKGTAFDTGQATLTPEAIAEKFWGLFRDRTEPMTQIS
jgi:NAD(P)-dependent dehydrogenase (short-subunit alcohol dehydrogenase family)